MNGWVVWSSRDRHHPQTSSRWPLFYWKSGDCQDLRLALRAPCSLPCAITIRCFIKDSLVVIRDARRKTQRNSAFARRVSSQEYGRKNHLHRQGQEPAQSGALVFSIGRRGEFSYGIKTEELVNQIADVEFIVTDNEAEAFILEASLVKQHQPYFNYKLKDDKSYPHLKLTVNEPFPKCVITRRIQNDGALYFGPFLPAAMARKTIDLINRTFQLRTCDIEIDGKAPRPCLEYHIKRCLGPCVKGLCAPEEYREAVRDVRMLLEGRNTELADKLEERMLHASEELRYELAAKYRDLRKTVIKLSEQQKMATTSESDIDIFGYYREGKRLALQLFTMREGDIVGRREFFWEDLPEDDFNPANFIGEVLMQYYSSAGGGTGVSSVDSHAQDARAMTGVDLHRPDARPPSFLPREIHVPVDFEDRELLERVLSERRGRRVHILAPQRGEKRDMIDLVEKNAKLAFEQRFRVLKPDMKRVLEEMQETLELPRFPARI